MKCGSGIEARQVNELFINIDPIQAGGRLTGDAIKAIIAYGDGYRSAITAGSPTGSIAFQSHRSRSSIRRSPHGSTWTRPG